MKKATNKQILQVAASHDAIGYDGERLYGVTQGQGSKVSYPAGLYRDSLWNLVKAGHLIYNGDYTYSVAK